MNLNDYPDRDMMFLMLADRIAGQLSEQIRHHGRATLSVPGGTTPGPVFDILSGVDLDWANVAVVLNDERWVPETSERSNTRLLRARLLRGKAAAAQLIPLYAEGHATPETALAGLEDGLRAHLPLSVVLLGMGEDMHTASLFPGGDRLSEALADDAPLLLPMRAAGAAEPRITLTAPVLRGAMHIHVLISGEAKREAIEKAAGLSPTEAPIRAVLDHAEVHWAK